MDAREPTGPQVLHKTWLPSDTEDTSNPSYYKSLPKDVEVYEIIEAVCNRNLGFTKNVSYSDLAHIIRYTLRLGAKNGSLQELKKVQWYLGKLIEREEQQAVKDAKVPPVSARATWVPEDHSSFAGSGVSMRPDADYPDEGD